MATAVLFPIVMSMGGIAGTQTLTLMVRGMATGQVSARNTPALLRKELAVGLLNGLVFSVVVAAIAMLWYGDVPLGLVMAAAILLNLLAGALAGALVPVVLKRLSHRPGAGRRGGADNGNRRDRHRGVYRSGDVCAAWA